MLTDGTIGVLYMTYDGTSGGLPTFSAHLARSTDQGSTFSDVVLQSLLVSAADNGNARQRIFGDFEQMKAVGTTFYGVYSGNRNGFGSTTSAIDPIFFSVPQATQTTVTSSVNPSVFTQPVSFTATVAPVPDGGRSSSRSTAPTLASRRSQHLDRPGDLDQHNLAGSRLAQRGGDLFGQRQLRWQYRHANRRS